MSNESDYSSSSEEETPTVADLQDELKSWQRAYAKKCREVEAVQAELLKQQELAQEVEKNVTRIFKRKTARHQQEANIARLESAQHKKPKLALDPFSSFFHSENE